MVSYESHFHVDVLRGKLLEYVRGPELVRVEGPQRRYRILDDHGCLDPPPPETALPLAEALKLALQLLRQQLEPPVYPLWNSAPWHLLGYGSPTAGLRIGDLLRADRLEEGQERWREENRVGIDGLPTSGKE